MEKQDLTPPHPNHRVTAGVAFAAVDFVGWHVRGRGQHDSGSSSTMNAILGPDLNGSMLVTW